MEQKAWGSAMGSWATLASKEGEEVRLPGLGSPTLHFLSAWTEACSMVSLSPTDTQVRERQEPTCPGH